MRELLKELKRMGKTIIISSHILRDLAELCNVVGIIEKGNLIFSGSVKDIMKRARIEHAILVTVAERTEEAAQLLAQVPGVTKVAIEQESVSGFSAGTNGLAGGVTGKRPTLRLSFEESALHHATDIPNRLIQSGFRLVRFSEEDVNLETAFMRLTQGLVQ